MNNIIDRFLMDYSLIRSAETMRSYRWIMKQYENFLINNNLDVLNVTKDNVEKFLLQCSSFQIRKKRLSLLKKFYNYLIRKDLIMFNPASRVKLLHKVITKVPKVPGQAKVNSLVGNIYNTKIITSVRNHLMFELAYGSGLRRCELMSINVEDINISSKTLRVKGKGSKPRIVPLTEKSLELLRRYLSLRKNTAKRSLFLSSNTGKRLTNIGISKAFSNNIGIRPHLLRHACATHMLDNGCDIRYIQQLLGHKSLTSTQGYTQVAKKKLSNVINLKHPRNNTLEKGV